MNDSRQTQHGHSGSYTDRPSGQTAPSTEFSIQYSAWKHLKEVAFRLSRVMTGLFDAFRHSTPNFLEFDALQFFDLAGNPLQEIAGLAI